MELRVATAAEIGIFHDDAGLPAAFAKRGIDATWMAWQEIDPDDPSPVLVRTPWDYTDDRGGFAAWLAELEGGAPCINDAALMAWNLDKRYLLELEEKGHAIVPTRVLPTFDEDAIRETMAMAGWQDAIAKPAVGAGAEGLVRIHPDSIEEFSAQGNSWLKAAQARPQGPCLLQPTLDIEQGEWSLFFFGGAYSHAILKTPARGDIRVQEEHGGMTRAAEPDRTIREAAEAIVAETPAVYARVDGVVEGGRFLLMELELIEPELYFRYADGGAPGRFADAVAAVLP